MVEGGVTRPSGGGGGDDDGGVSVTSPSLDTDSQQSSIDTDGGNYSQQPSPAGGAWVSASQLSPTQADELVPSDVVWVWGAGRAGSRWNRYDSTASSTIEAAYQRHEQGDIASGITVDVPRTGFSKQQEGSLGAPTYVVLPLPPAPLLLPLSPLPYTALYALAIVAPHLSSWSLTGHINVCCW